MKIEQALHGYYEGHKLLASSVETFSQTDRRKMSILSDWDEYVPDQEDSSYLTCYPLPNSPYYVVAKTWYASEMKRPGCVWTHSLLFNFSEITSFFDFLSLLSLFVRPKKDDYEQYSKTIKITGVTKREIISDEYVKMPSLDFWISKLYDCNEPLVLTYQGDSLKGQQFLLSLMNHIPQAMIRGMSFCSGTGRLRKFDNEVFDFQMTSEVRRNIPNISGKINAKIKVDSWFATITDSVLHNQIDIPMLIYRFKEDIGTRVDALAVVVMVYTLLDRLKQPGKENVQKFVLSLRMMATVFPKPEDGERFKTVILSENVTKYFFGEDFFVYQMAVNPFWRSYNYEIFNYEERVRRFVTSEEVHRYAPLMNDILKAQTDNPYAKETLLQTIREYNDGEARLIFEKYWDYYYFLIKNDSRMLNHKVWITAEKEKFIKLLQVFVNNTPERFDYWELLLSTLLWEDITVNSNIINLVGTHIPSIVNEILNRISYGYYVRDIWKEYCKAHNREMLVWMKEKLSLNKEIVRLVMDTFDPSSDIVRQSEPAVWNCMLSVDLDNGMILEYSTFMFVLSYNLPRSDYSFAYYQHSFLPIYEATLADRIDDFWPQIGPLCPKPFLGWEWDRCEMLRKGFAERVFNENRGPKIAKNFTTKSSLNKKLYKLAEKKYRNA